jgi:hypothetical protein
MGLVNDRLAIRERRANGETVAALAREFAITRQLVRTWTCDVVPKIPARFLNEPVRQ